MIFIQSCVFSSFLQLARIIYTQGKKYIIVEQKKRKNTVPNLEPNNDLGSILISRTDGVPFCI